MPSLGYEKLCIVVSFLAFCFICWSSSFVHFKNGPEYLTRGRVLMFIPCVKFLQQSLVSRSLLVRLRCSFLLLFFNFLSTGLMVTLPIFSRTCDFPFLRVFWFFLDLAVLFLPLFVSYRFSLLTWQFFYAKFHSYILTVYSYCLY